MPKAHAETAAFTTLGLMQDMSRNAVMRPATVELMLRRIALMGMNQFMLYTEDTDDIPTRPYFGYMRGRYTHAELRRIDDYAHLLGIEVVPCIQAIGHLWQALKHMAFAELHRSVLPELAKRVERLYDHHRALWLEHNKSQGWEVLESRYATLLARVRFAHERVGAVLAGRIDQLEELEEKRLPMHTDWGTGRLGHCGDYRRMYSPTFA